MFHSNNQFVALLPVRDEADVIGECLTQALTWADKIFVYDTGSLDGTYDIVNEMAKIDARIRPIGREPVYFNEPRVRGLLFETARKHLRDGDWFLRIDADEIHHIRPQDFVANFLHPGETVVYHQYYDFQLTRSEAEGLGTKEALIADRAKPLADRRRNYTVSVYSEPRMARYRSSMHWPGNVSFPYNAGVVARERLPIRHYPHRDPTQLDRRCRLRSIMMQDQENRANWNDADSHHWTVSNWKAFVVEDNAPGLLRWEVDGELPTVKQQNHLPSVGKRLLLRLLYTVGLPRILDRTRPSWTSEADPLPIKQVTQDHLFRELGI